MSKEKNTKSPKKAVKGGKSSSNRKVKKVTGKKSKVTSVVNWVAPNSGRQVFLKTENSHDSLLVHSPEGNLEFQIDWSKEGPVVKIAVAKLELISSGSMGLKCFDFELQAKGDVKINSENEIQIQSSELRAKTTKSIHMDGEMIRLNSPEGEDKAVPDFGGTAQSMGCHKPEC